MLSLHSFLTVLVLLRMKKIILLSFLLVFTPILSFAQNKFTIKGSVIDNETKEALMGANIQILNMPDSSLLTGAMADELGAFTLHGLNRTNYVMKVTFMGYIAKVLPLNLKDKKTHQIDLGYLTLLSDSKMLKEAVVSTTVAKVQVSGDSIQFNAAAYRTPTGSTLEALVKLLPGAEVDDDGNITINGKSVSKILVDGKEFFLNDKSVAMKNIPVDIIDKIKSYERKSDMARITGVDDGEEETVLDLSVKKGMKNGWYGNATAGAGSFHRYNLRGIVNHFNDNSNVSVLANGRNVPERQGWGRVSGLNSHKEGGMNFASKNTNMETGGSVTYKYDGSDYQNRSNTHELNAIHGAFRQSQSSSYGSNHSLDAQFKMEWHPDTMTTILFRPNFTYSQSNNMSQSNSGKYNFDVSNMDQDEIDALLEEVVLKSSRRSQSHNNSTKASGEFQITRKFTKPGRNVTLRMSGDYSQSESQNISASLMENESDTKPVQNNRYNLTPSHNYHTTGQFVWSEPLADRLYLNFSYRYTYGYSKSDRQAFVYDNEAFQSLSNQLVASRYDVEEVLRVMREAEYSLRDSVELSRFSEYRNYNQRIGLQIRQVREKYNFSAGVDAFPQRTKLNYRYMGKAFPGVSRQVFNLAPRVNLKFNFDKTTNLQLRYNGRSNQPSMTDLLDIYDDSNPEQISKGNAGLKPSFDHNWNVNYNSYKPETQRGLWSWFYGNTTRNSIANKVTYRQDGVTITEPVNINGNWNVGAGVGANIGLGKEKKWSIGGNVGGNYRQNVGVFGNIDENGNVSADSKSISRVSRFYVGPNFSYRNEFFSIELRGRFNEEYARNNINKSSNRDVQDFWYGSDLKWNMPWGTELATDIRMNSRRGYSQHNMNTDELLWNASISQSFLKGNALTVKGEIYDILGQQTNITHGVSASSIGDSFTNGIFQYGLVSLIYRFSVFAGRNTMGTAQERR